MVVRTARRAAEATTVGRVVVATDDERIVAVSKGYDIEVVMTEGEHMTGTDRVVEVCRTLELAEVVNIQGDEPLIDPGCIDALVRGLSADADALVANAACPLADEDIDNKNVVKAICDQRNRLMCLSRHPLPFSWGAKVDRFRHLGLYAFKRGVLDRFAKRAQGPLERSERVEMYRFLEYGDPIVLVKVPPTPPAVDVPEDMVKIQEYVLSRGGWEHFYSNVTRSS